MTDDQPHWYALRVFFNKVSPVENTLKDEFFNHFIPHGIIPSLIFVQTSEVKVKWLQEKFFGHISIYTTLDKRHPAIIPDKEMDTFMFVCTAGQQGLLYLGDDKPEYHIGEKVRVIEGPFKGIEGHIKRIKKDRRIIVSINGIAAIATTFIPPQFLERCTDAPSE